jgi:hypothetical protein
MSALDYLVCLANLFSYREGIRASIKEDGAYCYRALVLYHGIFLFEMG